MAETVGVLGVGKVGAAVARRLARAGYGLRLYNRTSARADDVAQTTGGTVVSSPHLLVTECEVVWGCLTGWDAVSQLYLGPDGALSGSAPSPRIFVELGTLEPDQVRELEDATVAAGHQFVYAAITGRPIDVDEGRAFILASGKAVALAEPTLSELGSVHQVSEVAADAAVLKLAVNLMLFASLCSAGEALGLARKAGIDGGRALDLLLSSPVSSTILQLRRDSLLTPETQPLQSTLDLAIKNYGSMSGLADQVGAYIPQTRATAAIFRQASAAGYGPRDSTWIAQYLREMPETGM